MPTMCPMVALSRWNFSLKNGVSKRLITWVSGNGAIVHNASSLWITCSSVEGSDKLSYNFSLAFFTVEGDSGKGPSFLAAIFCDICHGRATNIYGILF